jgi:hypothetical protein
MKTYGMKLISITVISILVVIGYVMTDSRQAFAQSPNKSPDPVTTTNSR